MTNLCRVLVVMLAGTAACATAPTHTGRSWLIVGNDEKVRWNDEGNLVLSPPGKDTVSFIDVTRPGAPVIAATVPLPNNVFGPPTPVAITPDGTHALVASGMLIQPVDGILKQVPDDRLFLLDLRVSPPTVVATATVGKQPTGLSINRAGTLALVANKVGKSVSLVALDGNTARTVSTVTLGASVSSVAFTADGTRALVTKNENSKVAVLRIDGQVLTDAAQDVAVDQIPINVMTTPDGRLALTANIGSLQGSDGKPDTVSVIGLEGATPHLLGNVEVGDTAEGLAISPNGKLAVVAVLRGSNSSKAAPYYNAHGHIVALRIDGTTVTRGNEVEVGSLPEGLAFSPDSTHVYVGNFLDGNMTVLRFDGTTDGARLVDTGVRLPLPGHPASMR